MRPSTWIIVSFLACAACGSTADEDAPEATAVLEGPYLGQAPPGSEPELFAPDLVSTGMHTRDVTISPEGNEIYFSVQAGPVTTILGSRRVDGIWTQPQVADFAADPAVGNIEPHISPDGSRFFFVSNRLPDGSPPAEADRGGWVRADIWMMMRSGDTWGAPVNLGPPVNTEGPEYFPSSTASGTLYFTREEEGTGRNLIFRSRRAANGEGYEEPELLPEQVNSATQFNAFVAPDESYLILGVFGREDSEGGTDYYVVFRNADDTWSEPVNLGPSVNQARGQEWSPYVSPDGRYFFFMSTRQPYPVDAPDRLTREWLLDFHQGPESGNPAIYWMDAGFIEDLRPAAQSPDR